MTTPVADQYAIAVRTPTSLTPIEVPAAPVPAPRTGLPALFNADTMSHAGLTAVSLGGLSIFAYAGGLTTSIIAVAALATGAIASRFLGNRSNSTREIGAALEAERKALNSSRGVLEHQLAALQGDRVNLDADRATLAADRQDFGQRVASEAQRIVAPQLEEVEAARAVLASERVALEERRGTITKALEKEAEGLSGDEVRAIQQAATAYYAIANAGYPRFAAASTNHDYTTSPSQRIIAAEQALIVLLGTGQLVAGSMRHGSDREWAIPAAGSTVITSIAQLRTFLRLATGHAI